VKTLAPIVFSIVMTVLFLPVGVVALVFSAMAMSANEMGRYAEARAKANTAMTLNYAVIGLVLVVGGIFGLVIIVAGIVADAQQWGGLP
jgi:uncharacterized protein YqhQ